MRLPQALICNSLIYFNSYFLSTKPNSFALWQAKKWASPTFSNLGDSFEQISSAYIHLFANLQPTPGLIGEVISPSS